MTFYQELQLNQAGSKKMLKTSGTGKEKAYHMLVYLVMLATNSPRAKVIVSKIVGIFKKDSDSDGEGEVSNG